MACQVGAHLGQRRPPGVTCRSSMSAARTTSPEVLVLLLGMRSRISCHGIQRSSILVLLLVVGHLQAMPGSSARAAHLIGGLMC